MPTKKESADFAAALKSLAEARPVLADLLGEAPTRSELLNALGELAPRLASSMTAANRVALVEALALTPEPASEPMKSFTTRLPASLVEEIKQAAAATPGGVQALARQAFTAYLDR